MSLFFHALHKAPNMVRSAFALVGFDDIVHLTSTTVLWIFGWNVSDLGVCCFQGAFWGTRCLVGDSVVGWLTLSIRGLPLVG